jgi:hypothetical protein
MPPGKATILLQAAAMVASILEVKSEHAHQVSHLLMPGSRKTEIFSVAVKP